MDSKVDEIEIVKTGNGGQPSSTSNVLSSFLWSKNDGPSLAARAGQPSVGCRTLLWWVKVGLVTSLALAGNRQNASAEHDLALPKPGVCEAAVGATPMPATASLLDETQAQRYSKLFPGLDFFTHRWRAKSQPLRRGISARGGEGRAADPELSIVQDCAQCE
jgi:hypothetical protein